MKISISAASEGARWARRSAACLCAIQFLAVLLCARPAPAAFEISWPDARSAGMLVRGADLFPPLDAGALRSLSGTATGSATEPGVRAGPRVTVSAGELYGISEAAGWGAHAAARFRGVSVGVELATLGGELYQERSLGLEVGLDPDPDLHLVARARALGLGARGVDDRWAAAVDVSVTRRLIGRVFLGAGCENLTRSRIGDSPVAARTRFGAALLLPSVTLRWILSFEEPFAASTTLGFEAALTDWLRVRAGARDAPGKLGFGIGVGRPRARPWPLIDLAWQWHPELGVSSFVSITMQL
jgi:hypothetical protein